MVFKKVLVAFGKVLVVLSRFGEVLVVLGSDGFETLGITLIPGSKSIKDADCSEVRLGTFHTQLSTNRRSLFNPYVCHRRLGLNSNRSVSRTRV